jgi:hypothetical protein
MPGNEMFKENCMKNCSVENNKIKKRIQKEYVEILG